MIRQIAAFIVLAVLLLPAGVAVGGPPAICEPVDVGPGVAIPIADRTRPSHAPPRGPAHADRTSLVDRVLRVLDSSDSALVHMETLRRATLEANADRAVAHALFARLVARTLDAEATGSPDALRWFDAGYLAQCYDQINMRVVRSHGRTRGLTGYAWVQHALELRGDDAEMEFGAAVMTVMAGLPEHTLHVARVEALAAPGSLVARNLEQHRTNRWKHFESRATKRTDR